MGAAAGCWVGLLARLAKGCWAEGLTRPTERIALREWDESCRWSMRGDSGEILRYAQDDRRGERVKRVFVESPLMSEMGQGLELERLVLGLASGSALGLVVDLGPHPSEDEPGPAERIRRSWEATKCAAMGPVVGRGKRRKQVPRCARNDNLQVRFEAGSMGGRRRVVGPQSAAGRAEVGIEVGVIRAVRVRAGRGSRGCS